MTTKRELIQTKYEDLLEEMKTIECLCDKKDLFPKKDDYSPEMIYNYFLYQFEGVSVHKYIKDLLDKEKINYKREELSQIYVSFFNFVKFLKEL